MLALGNSLQTNPQPAQNRQAHIRKFGRIVLVDCERPVEPVDDSRMMRFRKIR